MRASLLILIFGCLNFISAFSQDTLVIDADFEKEVLGPELGIHIDRRGSIKLKQAQELDFEEAVDRRPNLGFTDGAFWVKTSLINKSKNNEFFLQINQPVLDTLEVFICDLAGNLLSEYVMGEALGALNKPYPDRNFIVPFNLEQNSGRTIYLRIVSAEQVMIPVYISTPRGAWKMNTGATTLFGFYFGIIMVMALYNLFIYFTIKDKSYLLYVIYTLLVGLIQSTLEGYTHYYLWPESIWFAARSVYFFTCLVSIFSVLFSSSFLKVSIYAPFFSRIGPFSMGISE